MSVARAVYRTLTECLPTSIDWVSRSEATEILGISKQQLRRDQAVLKALEVKGFDYQPRQKGFNWNSLNCLWEFRHLVRKYGRARAIQLIEKRMRDYERSGQESSRATQKQKVIYQI